MAELGAEGLIEPENWTFDSDIHRVLDTLEAEGATARFVGGCVRDTIAGRRVEDYDLATNAVPSHVLELLKKAGITAIPTGIEHGTVTAVPGFGHALQITTLRRDVATDGRRAVVSFTTDWKEDAARRDLTINALSADREGRVYDYFGGIEDLENGRVRFVGNPADRIAEDYLRILRYFRFCAQFGRGPPEEDAIAACAAAADRLDALSGERVWYELRRILATPSPGQVLYLMEETGVLGRLLPGPRSLRTIADLARIESATFRKAEPLRRLAALVSLLRRDARWIARRMRMSRAEADLLDRLVAHRGALFSGMPAASAGRLLYRLGADTFRHLVLLEQAASPVDGDWRELMDMSARPPRFPLTGDDVMEAGIPEGPAVGAFLEAVEDWWIARAFDPDRDACLGQLREITERENAGAVATPSISKSRTPRIRQPPWRRAHRPRPRP